MAKGKGVGQGDSQFEDKGQGKETKPLLETKGLEAASKVKDATPKAKDAGPKAKEADPKATDPLSPSHAAKGTFLQPRPSLRPSSFVVVFFFCYVIFFCCGNLPCLKCIFLLFNEKISTFAL